MFWERTTTAEFGNGLLGAATPKVCNDFEGLTPQERRSAKLSE